MSENRVLVVGTTADYIDMIGRRYPDRALFLTDFKERRSAHEPDPTPGSELLCDLGRPSDITTLLREHLERRKIALSGIVCYDCESMALGARLAADFNLSYPSLASVLLIRDKYRSKEVWQRAGVPCPRADLVESDRQACDFFARLGAPVVIKPLTGSGSELTFKCANEEEIRQSFRLISNGLADRKSSRMYARDNSGTGPDPQRVFTIEEFVSGPEYSCDFIIDGDRVELIRTAAKISGDGMPFGTTLAYELPARLPEGLTVEALTESLRRAARAAGLKRAICMIDFMIRDGAPVFLELTPRPGGDCLPFLIRQSCGLDMLGLALDFAEGRTLDIPPAQSWNRLVGVRLFADGAGKLNGVDFSNVRANSSVRECYLKRQPGHAITLPPADYDSWMLGHIVFQPANSPLPEQCRAIVSLAHLDIQPMNNLSSECYHGSRREPAAADTSA